jgi:hypothetical protein
VACGPLWTHMRYRPTGRPLRSLPRRRSRVSSSSSTGSSRPTAPSTTRLDPAARPRPPRRRRRRAVPPGSPSAPSPSPSPSRSERDGAGRVSPIRGGRRTVARSPASAEGRPSPGRSGRSGRASSAGAPVAGPAVLSPGDAPGDAGRRPPRPPRDPRRRGREAALVPAPAGGSAAGSDGFGGVSRAAVPARAAGRRVAPPGGRGTSGGVAMGSVMGAFPSSDARSAACRASVAGDGGHAPRRAVALDRWCKLAVVGSRRRAVGGPGAVDHRATGARRPAEPGHEGKQRPETGPEGIHQSA